MLINCELWDFSSFQRREEGERRKEGGVGACSEEREMINGI